MGVLGGRKHAWMSSYEIYMLIILKCIITSSAVQVIWWKFLYFFISQYILQGKKKSQCQFFLISCSPSQNTQAELKKFEEVLRLNINTNAIVLYWFWNASKSVHWELKYGHFRFKLPLWILIWYLPLSSQMSPQSVTLCELKCTYSASFG